MKNIFNGKRFMSLLQKDALDSRNQYLKLILIVVCTFLVISLISILTDPNDHRAYEEGRHFIGSMFVCGAMLLAPFQLYKRYNHKIFGVNYFMLPASQFEKWLSMFFYCVIATPIVIILTITLIDLCMYPFYPWAEKTLWFNSSDLANIKLSKDAIITFFAFQSILFLGNVWFKRAKVQKTILAIIILMIAFVLFAYILVKVSGIMDIASEISNTSLSIDIKDLSDVPQTWKIITKAIYCLVAPIGLWIVSFMKMKEQQL